MEAHVNELALFAGAGGGILGGHLLGWTTVCAVERDLYAASVLAQRQNDGCLPPFPIWSDVETFDGRAWRGLVDVVSGGDPCQANSNASRNGKAAVSLGGEFIRIVREVQPLLVVRENPYTVRADAPWPWWKFRDALGEIGYRSIIFKAGACCVGGHIPKVRAYIIAVQGAQCAGLEGDVCGLLEEALQGRQDAHLARPDWGNPAPRICGATDGVAHRVDRIRALGNGQVPAVAAAAWRILS
ncbi:MAG: DNA cytosine methyltransferase [Verrucomicrobiota bacterium JB024]|nr:DNA cytosine methyltransferase [Verrucomicrobiota bacterium JB024]